MKPQILQDAPDFSLVLGGPVYQLYLRAHIARAGLELVGRRIVIFMTFAWLPLLLLAALGGSLSGGAVNVPFLHDIEVHVRFLIALPVLIAAEMIVHQRIRLVVRQFVASGVVVPEDMPKFYAAIDSTMRVRNSVIVECALIAVVYTVGLWVWRSQIALETSTWYGGPGFTPAGYWYAYVSIPLFQFILLRWYMRLVLWFSFLWKVSRLNLRLTPTHPDRAGGLGFLSDSAYAFAPILFAQGALLAAAIASKILYGGRNLLDYKVEIGVTVVFFIVCILGPLIMFTPRLLSAKRQGQRDYGAFASRYVQDFDDKWVRRSAGADEQKLGSRDIQSLADLGNSFDVVRQMRAVPFGMDAVKVLAVATVAPLLPLVLTIMPLEVLLGRLIKLVL